MKISVDNSHLFISFLSNPFDKIGVPGYYRNEWKNLCVYKYLMFV